MQQPAETEGGAVAEQGRQLRLQPVIRGRNAEPQRPVRRGIQQGAQRRGQHHRHQTKREQRADEGIDARAQRAFAVEPRHETGAQRQRQRVEQAQVVQEPQMRQRESRRRRRVVGRAGGDAREGARQTPDQDRDRDRRQQQPTGGHRHQDAFGAIRDEAARAATMQQPMREESRDQEEQAHPEAVDDVERQRQRRALRDIPSRDRQEKGHRCVQHDAQQQREGACGVERMEAIGLGKRRGGGHGLAPGQGLPGVAADGGP